MKTPVAEMDGKDLLWGIAYESTRESALWDVLHTLEIGPERNECEIAIAVKSAEIESMVTEALRRMAGGPDGRCSECLTHPGWETELARREPQDVCRGCLGSGRQQ